jgi:hypothetical protein
MFFYCYDSDDFNTSQISFLMRNLSPKLARAGLIRLGSDPDGRKKYLELTPKFQDYFAKMGQCIASASNQLKPE